MDDETLQEPFPFTEYCSRFMLNNAVDSGEVNVAGLRGIMLSELSGVAIRAFALEVTVEDDAQESKEPKLSVFKAAHEFDALGHIREDMAEVKRNLQKLVVDTPKYLPDWNLEVKYEIVFEGNERQLQVTRGCLAENNPDVTFVPGNDSILTLVKEPEQVITLHLWLFLDVRKGYIEADRNRKKGDKDIESRINQRVIPIDANHSPVVRCAIHMPASDGQILIEVETNGSITPWKALKRAYAKQQQVQAPGEDEVDDIAEEPESSAC